jgi:hypothetical protein
MARISNPTHVDNTELRELAIQAAWVAKLEDAVEILEDLVFAVDNDEAETEPDPDLEPWEEDPLVVALDVVRANAEEADRSLEERVTTWLAADPEHWPIFRLAVLDPWQEQPGQWRNDVPGWVLSLGSNTILAHVQQDPFGRQMSGLDDLPQAD